MNEFEPDLVYGSSDLLGPHTTVYLDGQKLTRCFQVRVKLASFTEPTFGEVMIAARRDHQDEAHVYPVIRHKPRLGEFNYDGVWARFTCGKILIELDEEGQRLLELERTRQGI